METERKIGTVPLQDQVKITIYIRLQELANSYFILRQSKNRAEKGINYKVFVNRYQEFFFQVNDDAYLRYLEEEKENWGGVCNPNNSGCDACLTRRGILPAPNQTIHG